MAYSNARLRVSASSYNLIFPSDCQLDSQNEAYFFVKMATIIFTCLPAQTCRSMGSFSFFCFCFLVSVLILLIAKLWYYLARNYNSSSYMAHRDMQKQLSLPVQPSCFKIALLVHMTLNKACLNETNPQCVYYTITRKKNDVMTYSIRRIRDNNCDRFFNFTATHMQCLRVTHLILSKQ